MGKTYVREGFNDKIQINLAKICGSENETFSLALVEYVRDYTCELCGHKHLSKCYWIKNNSTDLIIKVGSECVEHFSKHGLSKSDIDMAEGLAKLVHKSIETSRLEEVRKFGTKLLNDLPEEIKARNHFGQKDLQVIFGANYEDLPEADRNLRYFNKNNLIEILGNEHFKNLPRGEKYDLVNKLYRMDYAERLFEYSRTGQHLLTKEEIAFILDTDPLYKDRMESAIEQGFRRRNHDAIRKLMDEVSTTLSSFLRNGFVSPDAVTTVGWLAKAKELHVETEIQKYLDNHQSDIVAETERQVRLAEQEKIRKESVAAKAVEFAWITGYAGTNNFLLDLQRNYNHYHNLTPVQIARGKEVLDRELNPPAPAEANEISSMLDELVSKFPDNTFYRSVRNQYIQNGSISPKQTYCIRRSYSQECK